MYSSWTADVAVAMLSTKPRTLDPRSMCLVGPLCDESSQESVPNLLMLQDPDSQVSPLANDVCHVPQASRHDRVAQPSSKLWMRLARSTDHGAG